MVPTVPSSLNCNGRSGNKLIGLALLAGALVIAANAGAGGASGSATGGSQLTVHDVFGLQTLELQSFGFNARLNRRRRSAPHTRPTDIHSRSTEGHPSPKLRPIV